jgi:cell wall-associated NlpC family hydrolase
VAVLVVVTVLAALAAPHARTVRGLVAGELAELPAIGRPGRAPATGDRAQAARAVAFALAQRGKSYRWGAQGPHAFDCSGLTWAAWRAAGVTIPRTAAGQLATLPRARGRLQPGDLLIYRSTGPTGRHVAMVVGRGRMVEALGRGIPVRSTSIRPGYLGAVRPGAGR